jgi:hypothetical protein
LKTPEKKTLNIAIEVNNRGQIKPMVIVMAAEYTEYETIGMDVLDAVMSLICRSPTFDVVKGVKRPRVGRPGASQGGAAGDS